VTELSKQAERLLAVAPESFVEERTKLVRELRDAGRRDEADAVAGIKKPSPVVLAVNRAARDRPQAAKDAAKAAERVGKTQLAGKPDEYRALVADMEVASGLLSEVAVANLSKTGKPTDAMRRRVADHIRGALASEEARRLLVRGALADEVASPGFDAYLGLPGPKKRSPTRSAREERDADRARRTREKKLKAEIAEASAQLAEVERRLRAATRERDAVAKRLDDLEARLESEKKA
jgi:hypothetical protein